MSIKKIVKKCPGVVSGTRLIKRMVALVRRKIKGTTNSKSAKSSTIGFSILPSLDGRHRFVGYYDHSPFKKNDESLILIHSTKSPAWRRPSPNEPVSIELVNHQNGTIVRTLGESYAWNWQQGARALWLNADVVIFNIYDSAAQQYRARMVDSNGKRLGDLPIAVQEVDSKGRVYGLSYEALGAIRADYGYRNKQPNQLDISENIIEQFDPVTREHICLVSVSTLKEQTEQRHDKPITKAKFNHVMASPDAKNIIFLFRYFVSGRRITDLYTISTSGGSARILISDRGVSHVCWWDDTNLITTMMGAEGFGYYLIPIDNSEPSFLWAKEDGHPGRLDEAHFLTDTYPDRYALRYLLTRNIESGEIAELGAFPEPLLYQGETRCDLHPSLSPSGRYIQVDSTIGHRRTVSVLMNPLFNEKYL